ncbi:MAG: hypothetical protein K6T78_08375 [Alicyclobacillus sp.]|nr:hypothetical protein [Alicyclobacillus sp.]
MGSRFATGVRVRTALAMVVLVPTVGWTALHASFGPSGDWTLAQTGVAARVHDTAGPTADVAPVEVVTAAVALPAAPTHPVTDAPLPNGPASLLWRDGDDVYRGVHYIARWDATTDTWQPVSPNLTEDEEAGAPGSGIDGITALAHAEGAWYVGTLAGVVNIQLPGQPWYRLVGGLPYRTVTAAVIFPTARGGRTAAIGYGGYASATPDAPGHVYRTTDGGQHWADITENLPDAPVESLHIVQTGQNAQTGWTLLAEVEGRWYQWQGRQWGLWVHDGNGAPTGYEVLAHPLVHLVHV